MIHICDYGCEKEAKYQFKNGKWCCSKYFQSCNGHKNSFREKIRISAKKYYENETSDQKINRINAHKKIWKSKKKRKETSQYAYIYNQKNKRTIEKIKRKFSLFYKVEDMKYDIDGKTILVHCKNHNCQNSKNKNGWFIPTGRQLEWRVNYLSHKGTRLQR